jgi:hypothetical protein
MLSIGGMAFTVAVLSDILIDGIGFAGAGAGA